MKVIGIDTSTMMGSIGLIDNGRPVALFNLNIEVTYSERLLPALDILLEKSRIKIEDIDLFSISIGPGSFTGLRIGLGTVKGLSMALHKPFVGVSSLEVLAMNVPFCPYIICPVIDARKREVYTALFSYQKDSLKRLTEDLVISPVDLIKLIQEKAPSSEIILMGDGVAIYRDLFIRELGKRIFFAPPNASGPSAINVAQLGLRKFYSGETLTPVSVPLYIRKSEAELKYGRGHKKKNI